MFVLLITMQLWGQKNNKPQQFIYSKKTPVTFDATRLARIDSTLQQLVKKGMQLLLWLITAKWYITRLLDGTILKNKFPVAQMIFFAWRRKPKPLRL